MAKKKSVIAGEYIVSIAENGHVDVDRIPRNVTAALREIAEAKKFPYDKTWTQRQLANKLLKEFGDGNTLFFNDYTVSKREDGGIDVIQSFSDGHVMAALRDIAEKIGFEYGKWNNHHMGRKLVDYLMEHKAEVDKILQTPNGKLKELEEAVSESADVETSTTSAADKEQNFDCYVLGINYTAEHLITVKKSAFPSIDDVNEYNDEFAPLGDEDINARNIEDVFDRYDGPLNFIYECSDFERRLNITSVSDLRLVKLQSEETEAEEAYRKENHKHYDVDGIDYLYRSLERYDLLNDSSDKLLLRGTYPITCTAGFALRLPSGTQFDPSKLKITNNEDGGDPFLAFYDGASLEYLFAGKHDADYEQDVKYTVYFDRHWFKPYNTRTFVLKVCALMENGLYVDAEDSITKEWLKQTINQYERGDYEMTDEDSEAIKKLSKKDLIRQYSEDCGGIFSLIRATEEYERRVGLIELTQVNFYDNNDEDLDFDDVASGSYDDDLSWVHPGRPGFTPKEFQPSDFDTNKLTAYGLYGVAVCQYALHLADNESWMPEDLTVESRAIAGRSADEIRVLYKGVELERVWADYGDDDSNWLPEKVFFEGEELTDLEVDQEEVENKKRWLRP